MSHRDYIQAGATIEPWIIFVLKGPVREDVEYRAWASWDGGSLGATELAKNKLEEEQEHEDNSHNDGGGKEGGRESCGKVELCFKEMMIRDPGQYTISITVCEATAESMCYTCVASNDEVQLLVR